MGRTSSSPAMSVPAISLTWLLMLASSILPSSAHGPPRNPQKNAGLSNNSAKSNQSAQGPTRYSYTLMADLGVGPCGAARPCSEVGMTCCNGECVSLETDKNNCGACNRGCLSRDKCQLGKCASAAARKGAKTEMSMSRDRDRERHRMLASAKRMCCAKGCMRKNNSPHHCSRASCCKVLGMMRTHRASSGMTHFLGRRHKQTCGPSEVCGDGNCTYFVSGADNHHQCGRVCTTATKYSHGVCNCRYGAHIPKGLH